VDRLRNKNKGYVGRGPYGFTTEVIGSFWWKDKFKQPSNTWEGRRPDIALQLIHPDFPSQIGKSFFELLSNSPSPPTSPKFAIAVGFPVGDKRISNDERGDRLLMPCVYAIADEPSVAGCQFYADLNTQPATEHLSGLSGGPVFWSTKDTHGLLGFVYEGSRTTPTDDGIGTSPRVHFLVVPITYRIFSGWIDECRLRDAPLPTIPWAPPRNVLGIGGADPEGEKSDADESNPHKCEIEGSG
jgi:hypothetical protein